MVSGPGCVGLRGRAPIVRDYQLRFRAPVRVELGPFEEAEVKASKYTRAAGLAEVDRDAAEGWIWLVQRKRLDAPQALTVMVGVRRPGEEQEGNLRVVFYCEGGPCGPGS